jgi:hypothetical protein
MCAQHVDNVLRMLNVLLEVFLDREHLGNSPIWQSRENGLPTPNLVS